MLDFLQSVLDFFDFVTNWWWFFLALIIVFVIAICNTPDEKEKRRKKRELKEKEQQTKRDYRQKYHYISCDTMWKHLYGLPIPQMTECEIWECEDCLIFYDNHPYVLKYSQLIKAEFMSRSEVKKHYVDDTTGAIVGAAAFGAIGALLGGGTKTVTEVENSYFVSLTYKSNNEIRYILFDVTNSKVSAKNFVKKIEPHIDRTDTGVTVL
jgi:hypothetical protein